MDSFIFYNVKSYDMLNSFWLGFEESLGLLYVRESDTDDIVDFDNMIDVAIGL